MADLSPGEVGAWLADRIEREPPPIFGVRMETGLAERSQAEVAAVLRDSLGARTQVVPESGAVRFRVEVPDLRAGPRTARPDVSDALFAACQAADDRYFSAVDLDPEESGIVVAAVRSHISESELPVVGPGGGATVFAERNAFEGEVVVRRRTEMVTPGRWRSPEEVVADLGAAPLRQDDVRVLVELGYFEAGAATIQRMMRPVYLFVLERAQPEDSGAGWRRSLAIPATTDDQLPPSLGLESWWEGD